MAQVSRGIRSILRARRAQLAFTRICLTIQHVFRVQSQSRLGIDYVIGTEYDSSLELAYSLFKCRTCRRYDSDTCVIFLMKI